MTEEQFRKEWEAYKKERNDRLHRLMVKIIVIFAVGGITMSITVAYVFITSAKNQDALCSVRHDAERRVVQTEQFLDDHPEGIPGIPVSTLQRGLEAAKETVKSLDNLRCPPLATGSVTP